MNDNKLSLNQLAKRAHAISKSKGFYDRQPPLMEQLVLVHAEVSEAVEASRVGDDRLRIDDKGKPVGVPAELADVLIRVLDICANRGIDIEEAVSKKLAYNETRPYKHGKKF